MRRPGHRNIACAVAAIAVVFVAAPATAVEPDEVLADAALEARARTISRDLRCVVCQNQSIDDSDAPLAKDLRVLVRERLTAGATDQEVRDYVVQRYGDYVLLKPRLSGATIALWAAPPITLFLALLCAVLVMRRVRQAPTPPTPLTESERISLENLLAE